MAAAVQLVLCPRNLELKADTLMRMQSAHELAEARAREDEIEAERVAA